MTIAVVTNECQRGVIGDLALWRALADSAAPIVSTLAALLRAARAADVPVVHCVAVRRADLRGASANAPLFEVANRKESLRTGTPSAGLLEELHAPSDHVHPKTHGLASLRTTGVDSLLRNAAVDTVVLTGVSVNVAITALAFEAVNLGYRVVIPTDAVAGVPPEYAAQVVRRTLSLVAEITTAAEITQRFRRSAP